MVGLSEDHTLFSKPVARHKHFRRARQAIFGNAFVAPAETCSSATSSARTKTKKTLFSERNPG
jgi:hypothetical protein